MKFRGIKAGRAFIWIFLFVALGSIAVQATILGEIKPGKSKSDELRAQFGEPVRSETEGDLRVDHFEAKEKLFKAVTAWFNVEGVLQWAMVCPLHKVIADDAPLLFELTAEAAKTQGNAFAQKTGATGETHHYHTDGVHFYVRDGIVEEIWLTQADADPNWILTRLNPPVPPKPIPPEPEPREPVTPKPPPEPSTKQPPAEPTKTPTAGGDVSYLGAQIVGHEGEGIKVVGVMKDSPAQHAGLQNGDLILEAEENSFREKRYGLKRFTDTISKMPMDKPLRFHIERDGKMFDVWIKLEKIDKEKLAALTKDTGQQFRSTYEKGWKMLMNQDYKGALEYFQKTIEAYPKYSYRAIGICYYHMGRYKDAFKYIEKAYVMDKKSPLSVFYVAACYDESGKEKAATHYYKKYLSLNHNNSRMNEIARTRLNELRKKHQISKDTLLKIIEAIKKEVKKEKDS